MSKKKILVADLLCGAGGSSTGCARALGELGLDMELVCVNHWPTAIETHKLNHPEARHYVQDIATVRPHLLVPEGYLDLLMASPTCTHHSVARGGKPTSDQQRSDPWHIITWLTELRVKRLIIENVWEFTGWGPVDHRTGTPVKSRKGEYFAAWIETIQRLGFEPEWRKLNAANYGDATTRQRFILKARNDRKIVGWAPITHMKKTDIEMSLFQEVQPWRSARDIIDWSLQGRSIFGRKKDLAQKTMNRIYSGMVKHGWPEPYLVVLRNHMAARGLDLPLPTIAANGGHIGLATPILLSQHNSGAARSASEPLPTITTGGAGAEHHPGCARPILIEPFIATVAHGNTPGDATADSRRSHSIDDPIGAMSAGGNQFGVVEPFVLSRHAGGVARPISEPTPTQVAKQSHLLIAPYYGSGSGEICNSGEEPVPSVTTKARFGMVVPITHSDGSNRARDVADPLPTLTTAHRGELAVVVSEPESVEQYDILFRMLEPHELAAAMGFNTEDQSYEFAGTKTDQIKQIGNAVSVAMMKAEVKAIMSDAVSALESNDNTKITKAA
jgi:DNA (cytosine-5)-methyltransferase 1